MYIIFCQNFCDKNMFFRHFKQKTCSRDYSERTQSPTQRKPLSWTFRSTLMCILSLFHNMWMLTCLSKSSYRYESMTLRLEFVFSTMFQQPHLLPRQCSFPRTRNRKSSGSLATLELLAFMMFWWPKQYLKTMTHHSWTPSSNWTNQ